MRSLSMLLATIVVLVNLSCRDAAAQAQSCCPYSCPPPGYENCPTGLSCCVSMPNWNGYNWGSCYNTSQYVCSSCPVYNPNHPVNTLCPIDQPMCCGSCLSPKDYQCCPPPTTPGYQYPCLINATCCGGTCCDAGLTCELGQCVSAVARIEPPLDEPSRRKVPLLCTPERDTYTLSR